VVYKASAADVGARMDLNPRHSSIELRNDPRQQGEARRIDSVRGAMQQDGMKSGVTEEDLQRALGGWIAVENRFNLFAYGPKHTALV
jgi:hypothetical protein